MTQPTPKLSTSRFKSNALPFKAHVAMTRSFEVKKEGHNMFITITTETKITYLMAKQRIVRLQNVTTMMQHRDFTEVFFTFRMSYNFKTHTNTHNHTFIYAHKKEQSSLCQFS